MQMELKYERGTYFKEHSHPNVRGKVVLETSEDLHGEPAYRLAEKDTEDETTGWYAYWQPARHLHDEVGVNAVEPAGELDGERLASVEENISLDHADTPSAPKGVNLDAPRVSDAMPDAAVEAITNTERE